MTTQKIIMGDCLLEMPKLADHSFDMVLADVPYGTTACKWDTVIPFEPMWEQLKRIVKPNGAIVMTASQPFTSALVVSNIKWFKYCWVWDKKLSSGALNANNRPMKRHEDIVVFSKGRCPYFPAMRTGRLRTRGGGKASECYGKVVPTKTITDQYFPTSILEISNANQRAKIHPTQKPVALMEYLIKTYTNEGDTVLDFTMGSGTTLLAAKNLNRNAVGIEISPEYCEIAKSRLLSGGEQLT